MKTITEELRNGMAAIPKTERNRKQDKDSEIEINTDIQTEKGENKTTSKLW